MNYNPYFYGDRRSGVGSAILLGLLIVFGAFAGVYILATHNANTSHALAEKEYENGQQSERITQLEEELAKEHRLRVEAEVNAEEYLKRLLNLEEENAGLRVIVDIAAGQLEQYTMKIRDLETRFQASQKADVAYLALQTWFGWNENTRWAVASFGTSVVLAIAFLLIRLLGQRGKSIMTVVEQPSYIKPSPIAKPNHGKNGRKRSPTQPAKGRPVATQWGPAYSAPRMSQRK